jgi:threonyl-tRNA synthetase
MKKKIHKLENIDHRNLNLNLKYFFFNEEAGQGFPF